MKYQNWLKRDNLLLNPENIPLVFGDELRFEFPIPVPGHIDLELAVLALEILGGVAIALIWGLHVSFL